MRHPLSHVAIAAALTLAQAPSSALQAAPAQNQSSETSPRITGFDVDSVAQLSPGTDLRFTVWGTPGAQAMLQIEGAQRQLLLNETRPGVYEGTYTISSRDDVKPDARVDANLRQGSRVGSARLDEVLQKGYGAAPQAAAASPRIDRFEVRPRGNMTDAKQVDFTLIGTPGGRASVRMVGAQNRFNLEERRPGEYVGTYTLQAHDRLADKDPLVGMLRVGGLTSQATIDDVTHLNTRGRKPFAACPDCATVQAINRVEVDGDGKYIGGTVAGGVLGAILGNQVGGGRGRDLARVAGAVGGAVAGREIQKRNTQVKEHYEVVVTMRDSGERKVVSMDQAPALRVGDAVMLKEGGLTLQR